MPFDFNLGPFRSLLVYTLLGILPGLYKLATMHMPSPLSLTVQQQFKYQQHELTLTDEFPVGFRIAYKLKGITPSIDACCQKQRRKLQYYQGCWDWMVEQQKRYDACDTKLEGLTNQTQDEIYRTWRHMIYVDPNSYRLITKIQRYLNLTQASNESVQFQYALRSLQQLVKPPGISTQYYQAITQHHYNKWVRIARKDQNTNKNLPHMTLGKLWKSLPWSCLSTLTPARRNSMMIIDVTLCQETLNQVKRMGRPSSTQLPYPYPSRTTHMVRQLQSKWALRLSQLNQKMDILSQNSASCASKTDTHESMLMLPAPESPTTWDSRTLRAAIVPSADHPSASRTEPYIVPDFCESPPQEHDTLHRGYGYGVGI